MHAERGNPAETRPSRDRALSLPADYRLASDRRLAATWCLRAADNLAAIELLQQIEAEDCSATADERQILVRGAGINDLPPRPWSGGTQLYVGRNLSHQDGAMDQPALAQQSAATDHRGRDGQGVAVAVWLTLPWWLALAVIVVLWPA